MSPTPVRLVYIRRIALRLAERGTLTAPNLARRARISVRSAHRWIAQLVAEDTIVERGCDPDQQTGRPRGIYGLGEEA